MSFGVPISSLAIYQHLDPRDSNTKLGSCPKLVVGKLPILSVRSLTVQEYLDQPRALFLRLSAKIRAFP